MQNVIKITDEQFAFLLAILMLESDDTEAFRARVLKYMDVYGGYGIKQLSSDEAMCTEKLHKLYVCADELFHQLKFLKKCS